MADWTKVCTRAELPEEGEAREFTVGEKAICIANIDGNCAAMDNVCLHQGGPLGQGVVAEGKVICPWHGWGYDPITGAADRRPGLKVNVYPIKVEGEDVLIAI